MKTGRQVDEKKPGKEASKNNLLLKIQ